LPFFFLLHLFQPLLFPFPLPFPLAFQQLMMPVALESGIGIRVRLLLGVQGIIQGLRGYRQRDFTLSAISSP
jgi:hypothetical protein